MSRSVDEASARGGRGGFRDKAWKPQGVSTQALPQSINQPNSQASPEEAGSGGSTSLQSHIAKGSGPRKGKDCKPSPLPYETEAGLLKGRALQKLPSSKLLSKDDHGWGLQRLTSSQAEPPS